MNNESPSQNDIIFYSTPKGDIKIEVVFNDENFWLTQKRMSELFGVDVRTVNEHLQNIYKSSELNKEATIRKNRIVQKEGKRKVNREIDYYNLDVIIAVGYRVNSFEATQFRIWATKTLREFIIKGFVLNDEMLKNGRPFGKDYFDELLERIREIRTSERRMYQKLGDIFEQCSADYSSNAAETKLFYKMIQNKLHFAITGFTAAEIIHQRANSTKNFMGLTTWKNSPNGKIMRSDIKIAKNYLHENEIGDLNLLVSAYLDLAELQARRKQIMTMKDWLQRTNTFLEGNGMDVLPNAGKVSHNEAMEKAELEFEKFREVQDKNYISDLDKEIKKVKNKK